MRRLLLILLLISPAAADDRPWSAMVVWSDGDVKITKDIQSEATCRNVLCYIEHARSCEEQKIYEAEVKAKQIEVEEKYRREYPCTVENDGSKTCPTRCGSVRYDKNSKWVGETTTCMQSFITTGSYRGIKAKVCFQEPERTNP